MVALALQHELHHGDCMDVMRSMEDNSVDSIVTDPPYGLGFMGKDWDRGVPPVDIWREALRVLKPGGHLLSFAGSRTYHRMATAIEDAGFEIRDQIMWIYGSGFPKSMNVSKAIDKAAGVKGERGPMKRGGERLARLEDGKRDGVGKWGDEVGRDPYTYAPGSDQAKDWDGWGTALKPAHEPVVVARKPFKGTVVANVLAHGTGALNVDDCRVPTTDKLGGGAEKAETVCDTNHEGWDRPWKHDDASREAHAATVRGNVQKAEELGRWPANVIHDGSEEVVSQFPTVKSGGKLTGKEPSANQGGAGQWAGEFDRVPFKPHLDSGSAARFFYCAKASKKDRGEGNNHPTVKPTDLMRYLCRLVTPPGGTVLDPFMGSGSTGKAALAERFQFIGIERDEDSFQTATQRITNAESE